MAWRYCGNQVKLWRIRAGVSRESLGETAGYEYESVKSMEQGRRRPSLRLLEVADEMCGAQGLLLAAREYLKPERFPARTLAFMQLESEAIAFYSFEPLLIPGLLQTEEYARELMSDSCPPLDDETLAERVAARMQRQEKLRDKPKMAFGFVIYEAALRTLVGGPEVMRRQLNRLLEVGELRNVSIQVLPVGRGAYAGLSGSLVLLETVEHDRYALVEGQETSMLHADPERISALAQRHGMIRMQALSAEESARFIEKAAEEL
ncbi:helix-turn-helix domain-containing protein [Streptantibioticus ferralitis]|uniref:Helix-turn-helix transcriptional regulator n=1 Tax=Streptantibioticus ferralitis TaxID=236510 RepID=A0ABT5Z2M4_9ACTN|nr:helix-turn-helix transcriptional regulator [Streptantibioticus ferralitis]MDF2257934.1 helix-turn-helix transcriptional regulator [Streptantibioticus ferralitis]